MVQGTHAQGQALCSSQALLYSLSMPLEAIYDGDNQPGLIGILSADVVSQSHVLLAKWQRAVAISGFAAEVGALHTCQSYCSGDSFSKVVPLASR